MGSWVKRNSLAITLAFLGVIACGGGTKTTPTGVSVSDGSEAPIWEFSSLDARPVGSAAMMGRPVALVFVTTYDPICQQQVNYDLPLAEEFPNVMFALVALQDASSRELVEIYRDTFKIKFPVALADAATIAGGGTLGDVHRIPSTVLIGRDGKIVWRRDGGVMPAEMRDHLKKL
jgi:hypothetical protein